MPFYSCALLALLGSTHADLSFVAIGDWGGGDHDPTTESQELTADGMQTVAQDLGINFTVLAGDNFYPHGIACSAESSNRFRETFHDVYAKRMPQSPFYVLAGNHDYGNGEQANVSSQLAYSKFDQQWNFPAFWYKIHREFTADTHARTLDLLVIDTVILCGNGDWTEMIIDNQLRPMWPSHNKLPPRKLRQAIAEEQWTWLEEQLSTSTADFLWVTGHYSVWSAGIDGSSQCLIDRLVPLLARYNAHFISGHDHMAEHVQHGSTNFFVVGAGRECCYEPVNLRQIPSGALKYMLAGENGNQSSNRLEFPVHGSFGSFRFGAEYVSVKLHADSGFVLYEAPRIPRRKVKLAMVKLARVWWWIQRYAAAGCLAGVFCLVCVFFQVYKRSSHKVALEEPLLEN